MGVLAVIAWLSYSLAVTRVDPPCSGIPSRAFPRVLCFVLPVRPCVSSDNIQHGGLRENRRHCKKVRYGGPIQ